MTKRDKAKGAGSRFLGTYTLPNGQVSVGELKLDGPRTLLRLHSAEFLEFIEDRATVRGTAFSGEQLTLIGCQSPGTGYTSFQDAPTQYHSEAFPHYVLVGRQHLDPDASCIRAIQFTTADLPLLFYDFDAFGHVIDARSIIDTVVGERREMRPVAVGEWPQVFYFTGKDCISTVQTAIGEITVSHRPSGNMGGPSGVYIKNRIVVSVTPNGPVQLDEAIDRMFDVWTFLSVAAGRQQDLSQVSVTIDHPGEEVPRMLSLYQSFRPKRGGGGRNHKPHPGDVPLDPVRRQGEFSDVLADWIRRHSDWRVARGRYMGCLAKANEFGAERLVAAANMFDILPASATPPPAALAADVAGGRDECIRILRRLPPGIDRDGAISALGRMGKPSLPKKVLHRTSIVEAQMGARFPDLPLVAATAVKCRNFFVHGSAGDIDFAKVEPLVPFLTNALEFVFAASDLIEAGWDAARWMVEPMGWGHSFARFRGDYDAQVSDLRLALSS